MQQVNNESISSIPPGGGPKVNKQQQSSSSRAHRGARPKVNKNVNRLIVHSNGDDANDGETELRRRLPPRMSNRINDVYITRKTNAMAQLKRCANSNFYSMEKRCRIDKLFNAGHASVHVHGLGAACARAINVSLRYRRQMMGSVDVDVQTDTVSVTDDVVQMCAYLLVKS
jgi:DNA-binding protein